VIRISRIAIDTISRAGFRGGAGAPGPHQQGASHQTPQFHYSLTGLPGDDVFDSYVHNMSSASGGFAPQISTGALPLDPAGGRPSPRPPGSAPRPSFRNPPLPIIRLGPRPPTS